MPLILACKIGTEVKCYRYRREDTVMDLCRDIMKLGKVPVMTRGPGKKYKRAHWHAWYKGEEISSRRSLDALDGTVMFIRTFHLPIRSPDPRFPRRPPCKFCVPNKRTHQ